MGRFMSENDAGYHVGNVACPNCNSTDNLGLYLKETSDGDFYDATCWGCAKFYKHNELLELGVIDGTFKVDKAKLKAPRVKITKEERKELWEHTNSSGKMLDGTQYRGLKDEYLAFYGHRFERNAKGEIIAVYYPETLQSDETGVLQGYKSRVLPKKFGYKNVGKTGISNDLSGSSKFQAGGRWLVIVGGEEDKVAAFQMFRDSQIAKGQGEYAPIAVESINTGEGSAAKQVAANYDHIDSFENIVVMLDSDKAGREAATKLVEVLPKDKVKVATLSGKDPNNMLLEGKQKQFISNFWDAKELIPSGIFSARDASHGVRDYLLAPKIPFPPNLDNLNEASRGGIKSTGAIINIIADTSTGKTLLSDALQYFWAFNSPLIPTTLSVERTKEEWLIDMYSIHLEKNISWFKEGMDAVDYLEEPDVVEQIEKLLENDHGEPRFHIIDERNGSVEVLKKQIDRAWKQYGSRLFILDPISDVLRGLSTELQDDFYLWEKQMKKEGLVFINILHTRKPPNDKDGKPRKVTQYDALGTGSSVQSADINIVLNRNTMSDDHDEKNTMVVDAPKIRGGVTGHVVDLYFDAATRKQYDKQDYLNQSNKPENKESPVQNTVEEIDLDIF